MAKRHRKLKKSVKYSIVAIVLVCVGLIVSSFLLKPESSSFTNDFVFGSLTNDYKSEIDFKNNRTINPEYLGKLEFDSGLVEEHVVQTTDNEKYLNYSWDLQQSSRGSIYLDYRNKIDDQNLIFYGHYVYDDESLMFSPLHELVDQSNYEANKDITLYLENEERHYVITNVYYYEMNSETLKYYHTNYNQEFFETYINSVNEKEFYDTGEELTLEDKWITLQTCVRNRDDLRLIVLAKEID